jgi:hypothetical protein
MLNTFLMISLYVCHPITHTGAPSHACLLDFADVK